MLIPFLRQIQQDYGDPIALVHDMAKGILGAIEVVFPTIADFICHCNELRDLGKDLFEHENTLIRNFLKTYKIRTLLRESRKKLKKLIDHDPKLTQSLNACQENPSSENLHLETNSHTYCLYTYLVDFGC